MTDDSMTLDFWRGVMDVTTTVGALTIFSIFCSIIEQIFKGYWPQIFGEYIPLFNPARIRRGR